MPDNMEKRLDRLEEVVISLGESGARTEGAMREIRSFMERQTAAIEKTAEAMHIVAKHDEKHQQHTIDFQRVWEFESRHDKRITALDKRVDEHDKQLSVGAPVINGIIEVRENLFKYLLYLVLLGGLTTAGIQIGGVKIGGEHEIEQ